MFQRRIPFDHKEFIVVLAPGGSNRPYSSPKNMAKDCKEKVCWNRNDTVTVELTEHERLVLDAIHQDATTTIRGMVAYLGISKFSVSRALKGLQKEQVIERMGSTKKRSWKVKA